MIDIVTGNWGDKYPDWLTDALESQIIQNMNEPFVFRCITKNRFPGWWNKLDVLRSRGRTLWIDVDSVIVGPLDALIAPLAPGVDIRVAKNWARSGHGGIQSSVMYWEDASNITRHFKPEIIESGLWGDQEFLTELRDKRQIVVEYFDERLVKSYKYHARELGSAPDGAAIVTFHGKPDPHEVNDRWVRECLGFSTTIRA